MFLHKVLRQNGRCYAMPGLCLLAYLFLPMTGFASVGKLTLTWNANTEPDIAGYRLYYGTSSRSYKTHTDVGLKTAFTMEGLQQGTYYFVITAYNKSGNESGYSNEVEHRLAPPPSVTHVSQISGPMGTEVTISGDNLISGTMVSFNGIPARVVLLSSNKVVAAVPQGFSTGPVTVTTPGGSTVATNFTATPAQSSAALTIPGEGVVTYSTIGPSSTFQSGYATVTTGGSMPPYGISLLTYSQNGAVSSAAALAAAAPTTSARIPIEHRVQVVPGEGTLSVKTGFSVVNTGPGAASLQFVLRNQYGNALPAQRSSVAQGGHEAQFLDQLFTVPDNFGLGSLEISSDHPVLIIGIRLTVNQSGKLLMSTLPVSDVTKGVQPDPVYFPRIAFGGGYQTTVMLLNTSDTEQTGEMHMLTESGSLMKAADGGNAVTSTPYRIAPGGVYRLERSDGESVSSGWIKVVPAAGSSTPVSFELIGLTFDGA